MTPKVYGQTSSRAYDAPVHQLEHAARALAWDGYLIPDVEVLGARVAAVARLCPEVHEWRTINGWAPQANPSWFHSWAEPTSHDHLPMPAVDLQGVLVRVSKVKRALTACGTLMTLAPCAVVLPYDHPHRPWPLTELDYYGIGVVNAGLEGPAELVLAPEDRSAEFGSSMFGRWLLEVLYSKVLKRVPETADDTHSRA